MAKEKIIYISAEEFADKLIEFSKKYGQDNFYGEPLNENGKEGIIRFYAIENSDDDAVGFAAVKKEHLSYWMEDNKDVVYVVKHSRANDEMFNALYDALNNGFSVDNDE